MHFDTALIAGVAEVLFAQGWSNPGGGRQHSNTDPGELIQESGNSEIKQNNSAYKGTNNPLGKDGKPLKCFKSQSVYHMRDKCPQIMSSQTLRQNSACSQPTTQRTR